MVVIMCKKLNYLSVILVIILVKSCEARLLKSNGDSPFDLRNHLECQAPENEELIDMKFKKNFKPEYTFEEEKKIFFFETSCRSRLDCRQACMVEAAARSNPHYTVYVLFAGLIERNMYENQVYKKALHKYKNVKMSHLFIKKYAKGTILQTMFKKIRNESEWPTEHTADALRYLFLYKYGGVYLDLDMILMKSLDSLGNNWVATQPGDMPGAAAIGISKDEVGNKFAKLLMRKFAIHYTPDVWEANGLEMIYRGLVHVCQNEDLTAMNTTPCFTIRAGEEDKLKKPGIHILPNDYFYRVSFKNYKDLYTPHKTVNLSNTFGIHTWFNRFDNDVPRYTFYRKLARKYCPLVYSLYIGNFAKYC